MAERRKERGRGGGNKEERKGEAWQR